MFIEVICDSFTRNTSAKCAQGWGCSERKEGARTSGASELWLSSRKFFICNRWIWWNEVVFWPTVRCLESKHVGSLPCFFKVHTWEMRSAGLSRWSRPEGLIGTSGKTVSQLCVLCEFSSELKINKSNHWFSVKITSKNFKQGFPPPLQAAFTAWCGTVAVAEPRALQEALLHQVPSKTCRPCMSL